MPADGVPALPPGSCAKFEHVCNGVTPLPTDPKPDDGAVPLHFPGFKRPHFAQTNPLSVHPSYPVCE